MLNDTMNQEVNLYIEIISSNHCFTSLLVIVIISEVGGQNTSPGCLAFAVPDDGLSHNLHPGLTGLVDGLSEH